jgi:hypothetical protein
MGVLQFEDRRFGDITFYTPTSPCGLAGFTHSPDSLWQIKEKWGRAG